MEVETDRMIMNLDDPINVEQFRLRKIVEDKFIKLEEEVLSELINKPSKQAKKPDKKKENDSKRIRSAHKGKVPQTPAKFNEENMRLPEATRHFKSPNTVTIEDSEQFPVFEVIKSAGQPFIPLRSPRLVKKQRSGNTAVFQFEHEPVKTQPVLSSHILPGVDIMPQLTIESIPGLSIPGVQRERKANVHVTTEKYTLRKSNSYQNEEEPISITNSTTSKFEEMEHLFCKAASTEEINKQEMSEEQIKNQLRARVKEILIRKYDIVLDHENTVINRKEPESNENNLDSKTKVHQFENEESNSICVKDDSSRNQTSHEENESCRAQTMNEPSPKISSKEDESSKQDTEYSFSFEKSTEDVPSKESTFECELGDAKEIYPQEVAACPSSRDEIELNKQLSTILEVSSSLTNILNAKPTISKKVTEEQLKGSYCTENTNVSGDLEDEDTLAPSSLDQHLQSDVVEHSAVETSSSHHTKKTSVRNSLNSHGGSSSKNVQESVHKDQTFSFQKEKNISLTKYENSSSSFIKEEIRISDKNAMIDDPIHNQIEGPTTLTVNKEDDETRIVRSIIDEFILEKIFDKPKIVSNCDSDVSEYENKDLYVDKMDNEKIVNQLEIIDISEGPLDDSSELEESLIENNGSQLLSGKHETISLQNISKVDRQQLQNVLDHSGLESKEGNKLSQGLEKKSLNANNQIEHLDIGVNKPEINGDLYEQKEITKERAKIDEDIRTESEAQTIDSVTSSLRPGPMSSGEVLPEVLNNVHSDGEAYESQVSSKFSTSDGSAEMSNVSARIDTSETESSSISNLDVVMSSLSSGEWRANPRQLQRLARLADSLRL